MTTASDQPPGGAGVRQRAGALEGIIQLVVDGELPIGQKSSEQRIADLLGGMSRTPVREAVAILARDGVLVQRPQVGVWVRPVSTRELLELTQIVYQIELLAADYLVEHPSG